MKIGDIDVVNSIVNLENDLSVLQDIVSYIINQNRHANLKLPDHKDVEQFREIAVEKLKKKYPNMGIKKS